MKQFYQTLQRDANAPKNKFNTHPDQVIRPPVENPLAKDLSMQYACQMEGFNTEAVFSCIGSTNMTDISQETPVSHYSLKQNDRSCNQSTEGQCPVATKRCYHNHKIVPAYWKLWQPVQQLLWLLLYVT